MFSSRAPGAKIVIIDRQDLPSELKSTPNLSYYKADLTDTSGLLDVCSTIKKEVGSPTVLINNAGMAVSGPESLHRHDQKFCYCQFPRSSLSS